VSATDLLVAVLAGIVQGVVEWLPVSSQGNLSLFLTGVGMSPAVALQLALFLQIGTTLSAASYYREEITTAARGLPQWRPQAAFQPQNALVSFILIACLATGIIGIPLYLYAVDFVGRLSGGLFIALIGVLLILTGILQLASESVGNGYRNQPTLVDACLVGAAQGIAILPGISRSGTTTSMLLFRSYDPPVAFRLSFLLSIPASLGAAALTVVGAGGLPGISLSGAIAATATGAIVGYLTIDALMRIVDRLPFWLICSGLGGLAIVGGGVVSVIT
jgi:undecaprenyl-diphosphatase